MTSMAIKPRASAPDWGRRLVILIPALWLTVFFLVPCLIVLKISLSQTAIAQPPYVPVLDLAAGWPGVRDFVAGLSFDNYKMPRLRLALPDVLSAQPRRSRRCRRRSCC